MKTNRIIVAALTLLISAGAVAQEAKPQIKWYGFIRNYFVYDSHSSNAGTEDLYYYMPNDNDEKGTFNFVAITSRLGVDVTGYEVDGYKVGAKIETDFYNKNSTTAILRLRQAFMTIAKDSRSWKIGQAWHPMAADMPDIFSLETGAPFGPFSRTPLVSLDWKLDDNNSLTAAGIWQMQYTSTGPEGATANYVKYNGIPEIYFGWNYKSGDKFLSRIGVDCVSIKPVKDSPARLTTLNAFMYDQYTGKDWTIKNKLTWATDGSHFNMIGGYGATLESLTEDEPEYCATSNISDWMTITYKGLGNWRPCILLGYIQMMGTDKEIAPDLFWKKLNAGSINRLVRIQPEIVYNLGKVALGFEYMMTAAEYGKSDSFKVVKDDLHWVVNNRIQLMAKYTF